MKYPHIIEELKKKGSVPGVDSIRRLLDELGHPERRLKIVHIAGTNGKGSVFAFLASILEESGWKVGRYVSPTIQSYEERFQINGHFIEKEDLERYYEVIARAIRRIEEKGETGPTLFEAETALAFLYFSDKKVDFALIETGMGGTFDATNVIERPFLTVLSSISYDHQAFLGNTIEEIARNKAGIIKRGIPVILAENEDVVKQLVREKAEEMQAPCVEVKAADYSVIEETCEGSRFLWENTEFKTSLPGRHQVSNAVTALYAAKQIRQLSDWNADDAYREHMISGIWKARWPGRLELLRRHPYFYRDGAHNPDGARKLAAFVEKHFTNKKIIYIMGVLKDKDYEEMLRSLMPFAHEIYIFRPANERGLSAELLARAIQKYGIEPVICRDVNEAVRMAFQKAGKEDVLIACGSLSFMENMEDLS